VKVADPQRETASFLVSVSSNCDLNTATHGHAPWGCTLIWSDVLFLVLLSLLGDLVVYDDEGLLCAYYERYYTIQQHVEQEHEVCRQAFQPAEAPALCFQAEDYLSTATRWGPQHNQDTMAYIHHYLSRALEASPSTAAAQWLENVMSFIPPGTITLDCPPHLPKSVCSKVDVIPAILGALIDRYNGKQDAPIPEVNVTGLMGLASLKLLESEAVASALSSSIKDFAKKSGGYFVMSLMEVTQDGMHLVLDELCRQDLPYGVIIEYFVASHNAALLKSLVVRSITIPKNIRPRFLLLKDELRPMGFEGKLLDAVIVRGWAGKGRSAWSAVQGDNVEAASKLVEMFKDNLKPEGPMLISGFGNKGEWPDFLSKLGMEGMVDEEDVDKEQALISAKEAFAQHGTASVLALGGDNGCVPVLHCLPIPSKLNISHRLLVIADTIARGRRIREEIVKMYPLMVCTLVTLGPGQMISDEANNDEMARIIHSNLQENSLPLSGIVFMAGLCDESPIGELSFQRFMKVSQTLDKLKDTIKPMFSPGMDTLPLWIVTEGVYVAPFRPQQSILQGLVSPLVQELDHLLLHHIDMSSVDRHMAQLAALVVKRAPEQTYVIDEQGQVKVSRWHATNAKEELTREVLASERRRRFVVEVDREADSRRMPHHFVVKDIMPPGDDEVQVEVHAASLNFRDIMVALNVLPEKSYDGSALGRNLGIEGAGIVVAVGKSVAQEDSFRVGDRVAFLSSGSFTNLLNIKARVATKMCQHLSLDHLAALSCVYSTAHYALVHVARIRKGDKVLIHSGAGKRRGREDLFGTYITPMHDIVTKPFYLCFSFPPVRWIRACSHLNLPVLWCRGLRHSFKGQASYCS